MRFGEYLRNNLTSEWSSQYIEYDDMKELFSDVVAKAPLIDATNQNLLRKQHFLLADEEYFLYCEKEASKINTFFAEKLAEALLRFDLLKSELEGIEQTTRNRQLTFSNVLFTRNNSTNTDQNVRSSSIINKENVRESWITNMKFKRSNSRKSHRRIKRYRFGKVNDLKLAFSEYYLNLILLKNYQTLNYTGFRKILKKHDKLFETTRGNEWRILYIDCAPFHLSNRVDQLMSEVERIYTDTLESGSRTRAMQRLRVPPLEEKQPRSVTFRLGIFIGMLSLLIPILIIVGISLYGSHSTKSVNWRAALHLYRSSFFLILHIIFFGINVYGWSTSGVNHVLIFEMDPRNHLAYQKYLEIGTFLMVTWFISFNGFLFSSYFDAHPFIQPFIFVLFLILFLINPFPICYRNSRFWFLRKLFRVFLAPFYPVEFADFWLGDQLCSLELVFFDIEFFICFYINETNWNSSNSTNIMFCSGWTEIVLQIFLLLLPSWFRFAQCLRRYRDTKQRFPHLVNAGKYATTFFVSITNALRRANNFDYHQNKLENPFLYLWILMSLISSTYKVIWDIKMDWGFLNKNCGENKYLREQIVYSRKLYYYISIILNVIFRYIWIINIFIHFNSLSAEYSDIVGFTFGLIEIFRRFIWNYFRLENEHLNNCGQFRATRDISIRPTPSTNDAHRVERRIRQATGDRIIEGERTVTIDEIPLRPINDDRRISNYEITRRKTVAEEFIDEMDSIFTLDSNSRNSIS